MKYPTRALRRLALRAATMVVCVGATFTVPESFSAVTDLGTAPLQTSAATLVKPNIFYVLDNSGSMVWDFMPDWVSNYSDSDWLARNSKFNGVYYDPAITYIPPIKYDGTSYSPMNAANTSTWTRVPYDGFGAMSTLNIPNTGTSNFFTNSTSGTTQNLTGTSFPATFYTFVPGEYCSSTNLRSCNTQTTASAAYPYPAYLRWCTTSGLGTCQAARIDSSNAPVTYTNARYPGMSSTSTITFSGISVLSSVSSVTVGGVQILSATATTIISAPAMATLVATNINACTVAAVGNCAVAGYSAKATGSVVTITSPGGANALGVTPVVTRTGSVNATATAFAGGTPGGYIQTTINSSTATYAYPGTTSRASTRTDCTTNTTTCTYAEEMTNFANWWAYYRTRMQAMKSATSNTFATLGSSYRLGFMGINDNYTNTISFLNVADNTTTSGGQKSLWYSRLTASLPGGSTPLRGALATAGRYFGGKVSTINRVSAVDPMQYACQRNYTLLSTDGYWNEATLPTQMDGSTAIGDQDSGENRPYLDGNSIANTLADVSEYFYVTDIRSVVFGNTTNASGTDVSSNAYSNKRQNMVTSTIGLGASGFMTFDPDYANATSGDYFDVANGTATSSSTQSSGVCSWQNSGSCNWPAPVSNTQTTIDDLWHAAVNGRGAYYSATNAADIKAGLTNFLNTVDASASAASAVAQSTPVLTASSQGYTFTTTFCSGKWYGDVVRYPVTASTGDTSTTPDWAQSGAGSDCESTSGALTTTALLDTTAYTARTIFTFDTTGLAKIPFAYDSMTSTMQNYFKIASISGLSQICSAGTNCLSAAAQVNSTTAGTTTGAGGVNLVNYLRGDRSNEGTPNTKYYRSRTHLLGDIVNSAPVYVQAPNRAYTDTGYAAFRTANAARQATIYVGANDGMLHAFNANTGAETWAYVPSVVMPNMPALADKSYAANHQYFVDGQIIQGDVYYNGSWRTILVGGLGGGGRAYYALDVTVPSSPTVLWEFSSSSTLTPNRYDNDLGFTYGAPIITKLSDGTWAAIVSSGYNNISPGDGKGKIWVLNAITGAVIKKIDNGVGSSGGNTVTGCSVAPCPSGLSRISAWTDAVTDNTSTQVYGGDLFGNVWRFDISALTASGGNATAQLLATLSDASGARQPVTTTPELGLVSGKHVVFIGTGAYLGVTDVTTTQVQSMYALKDLLTTSSNAIYANPRSNVCGSSAATNCFAAVTLADAAGTRTAASSVTPTLATMNGWFADMPESGERVDVDPVLYSGTLVYTSNAPSSSGACTTGGSSYINYVNFATGLTVAGASNVGVVLQANALSSAPVISVNSSGKVVATTKSSAGNTSITQIPIATSASGTRRISWRRLQN